MGFAAVARVTDDRWVACSVKDDIAFGLVPGGELKIETTICHEIQQHRNAVVIDNVAHSQHYRDHPVPALYGFQSYISVPIILRDGRFFGTLCAVDPRPARVETPEIIGMFGLFAELIAFHLMALERVADHEARLLNEQQTSELREQFIAVLGHDLRNPLAAIGAGAEYLQKTPLTDKASRMVAVIRASVTRMSGLIDDVMDFARGRLGSGLALHRSADRPLEPMLWAVIAELQTQHPDRLIAAEFSIAHQVVCDHTRIAQLLSNLLGNGIAYGAKNAPVRVRAVTNDASFELSVANEGDPIQPAALATLFQPFARGTTQANQQGLGLGLFIASEVARAHGGVLDAVSTRQETRFTFRMPRDGRAEAEAEAAD